MGTSYNDTELLMGLKQRNRAAFTELYNRYYAQLCYFAERISLNNPVAQDIVSESLVKLFQRNLDFPSINQLKSFLYTTIRNACLDYLRATKRHYSFQAELSYLGQIKEENIEGLIIRAEVLGAIHAAIKDLPERYKKIIELSLLEGKTNEEIAVDIGIADQSVRNRKSEGLKLLRVSLLNKAGLL
jgi:RNA polymerase sigma-70 factor (family 1)